MARHVTMSWTEMLLGCPIHCSVTGLDDGLHVLLTGGCKTHVGAVSICCPGEKADTKFFSGHKDQFVSAPWAETLAEKTLMPVCVVCGIHYDNATAEQIAQITALTDKMLDDLIKMI